MESQFEQTYHSLEKKHFWFKARRLFIASLLKDVDRNAKILDIGCSSGIFLQELINQGFKKENLYGIDISEKAIDLCHQQGLKNTYVMDAQNLQLEDKFDIIIASDCLEHLEYEYKALESWNRILKPGGKGYIFVPAFMSLWSGHDVVNHHFRRYKKKELVSKLNKNGFTTDRSSYWNSTLFPSVWLVRSLSRLISKKDKKPKGDLNKISILNGVFLTILKFENWLLKFMNLPFGISTFAIVTKNKNDEA